MKKRRIEITVSRRRTTIHFQGDGADGAAESPLNQVVSLPPATTSFAPIAVDLLPPATLVVPEPGTDTDCQKLDESWPLKMKREDFGKCE